MSRRLALCAVLTAGALAGCTTVALVSDYDAQTDAALSQLNTDVTQYVNSAVAAGRRAPDPAAEASFFGKAHAEVATLTLRPG